MASSFPPYRSVIGLLFLGQSLLGCHDRGSLHVTPWYRKETKDPWVIAPYALELGGNEHAETFVDGEWRAVYRGAGRSYYTRSFAGVVILNGHESGYTWIYRRGERIPVVLPKTHCPNVHFRQRASGGPTLLCIGCGASPPYTSLYPDREGSRIPCGKLTIQELDLQGRLVGSRTADLSKISVVEPKVQGFAHDGAPMFHVRDTVTKGWADDFHFAVTERGLVRIDTEACLSGTGLRASQCSPHQPSVWLGGPPEDEAR